MPRDCHEAERSATRLAGQRGDPAGDRRVEPVQREATHECASDLLLDRRIAVRGRRDDDVVVDRLHAEELTNGFGCGLPLVPVIDRALERHDAVPNDAVDALLGDGRVPLQRVPDGLGYPCVVADRVGRDLDT